MRYSVKQLASMAGISVRTLHYYDQIGLLKPAFVQENGYRCYEEPQLARLQQILFFRELEFSLEDILRIMRTPDYNTLEVLADQRKLLALKKARLEDLLATIDQTMQRLKEDQPMSDQERFAAFSEAQLEQYKDEARERWGNTEAYRQSAERTKGWGKQDVARVQQEWQDIASQLASVRGQGVSSPAVQQQIERHFQYINQFYDCSYEMYRGLGRMYVEDPRFAENYNKMAPDLAEFMRDAIAYYCDQHTS